MRNPLSLESFADWCERKPADEEYSYLNVCGCAYYQYLTSLGLPVVRIGGNYWVDKRESKHPFSLGVEDALERYPHTFGALSARLREASNATEVV